MKRLFLNYSLPAALLLGTALPVAFVVAELAGRAINMSEGLTGVAQVTVAAAVMVLFGGLWGRGVALAGGYPRIARAFWIAGITFFLLTMAAALGLGQLEQLFVERRVLGPQPIHVIFAIIFTIASFIATALLMLVMGWLLRGQRFGLQLAWRAGLASAATFLAADIIQDLLGRRVGGPNAAATITMLSVAFIGNFLAAGAAGAVLGQMLTHTAATAQHASGPATADPISTPTLSS